MNKDNIIEFKNRSTLSSPQTENGAARGIGSENIYLEPQVIDEEELKQFILDSIALPKGVSKAEMLNIIQTVLDKEYDFLVKKGLVIEEDFE